MVWISEGAADQSVVDFIETNNMKDRVVIDDASIEWPKIPAQLKIDAAAPSATTSAIVQPSLGGVPGKILKTCGAVIMLEGITKSLKDAAAKTNASASLLSKGAIAIGRKGMNSGTASVPSGGQTKTFDVDKEMPGMA